MRLDKALGDGKAEARAFVHDRDVVAALTEFLKHARLIFFRDADTRYR